MNYLSHVKYSPLQNIFLAKENNVIKQVLLVLAGTFILALSAQLSIPFKPVPLTFQSATVILIGMAYGPRNAAYTILTYYILGISGLPVFADYSAGITRFFGPTGGYLIGFLPAAFLSGYLAQKGWAKNMLSSFITACLGISVIFLFGVMFLANFIGWQQAFTLGALPFISSELIKLVAVAICAPKCWKA